MMDIRTARKIAADVGNVKYSDDSRRSAFHRLHVELQRPDGDYRGKGITIGQLTQLTKNIRDYFWNRAAIGYAGWAHLTKDKNA